MVNIQNRIRGAVLLILFFASCGFTNIPLIYKFPGAEWGTKDSKHMYNILGGPKKFIAVVRNMYGIIKMLYEFTL